MPTIEQIRAARALLDWSQSDLADKSGLSQTGIARIENGTNKPNSQTLEKITAAFEMADIEFISTTGVRRKVDEIKVLRGRDGFIQFMDDIYAVASAAGGEICLHNARPDNWYKWLGEDWFKMHSKRMAALGSKITFKITAEEGNNLFISNEFAEYRWFPHRLFNEQSFYAYGDKLAFLNFSDDEVIINILENKFYAEGFRVLFNIAWEHVAIIPSKNVAAMPSKK